MPRIMWQKKQHNRLAFQLVDLMEVDIGYAKILAGASNGARERENSL